MNVALAQPTTEQPFSALFAGASGRLPGSGSVAEARQAAFDDFARRGLPHRRIEEWKYTDLRALLRDVVPLASAPDQAAFARAAKAVEALDIHGTQKLVLVDGVFAPQLSDIASFENGIHLRTLSEALEDAANKTRADLLANKVASDAMISLNSAMATDGVIINVDDNAKLSKPVHIVHVATAAGASAFTRSLVTIGKGAHVTLVESFVAAEGAKTYQAY
ncbi:MAG TPA: Fe-S cluster assembly protein SufD, partial [Afipia sp.]